MLDLSKKSYWVNNDYKNSWFYLVYNVDLHHFFIPRKEIEKLNPTLQLKMINDFLRYLRQVLPPEDFQKISFEIIFIVENQEKEIDHLIGKDDLPDYVLLKYTLYKGVLSVSYQNLEEIKTNHFFEKDLL